VSLTHPYATVAELRAHLGDSGSTLSTELLERAISAASREIDRHCGRRFWLDSSTSARTYHPTSPYEVWTDDIGTTTGLVIKTGSSGSYPTTLSSSTYELHPRDAELDDTVAYAWWRILLLEGAFTVGQRYPAVQVTAKFGWSATPDAVAQACIIRAAALFKRSEAVFGVAGFGDLGVVRLGRFDPDVQALLAPYAKTSFG
jgi:hypothetical protein